MIAWVAGIPGWLITHPWALAVWAVGTMALALGALLLNRRDRQVREILRRKP